MQLRLKWLKIILSASWEQHFGKNLSVGVLTFYGFGRRGVQGVKNSAWRARNEKFGVECAGNSAYIFVNLRTVGVRMQVTGDFLNAYADLE